MSSEKSETADNAQLSHCSPHEFKRVPGKASIILDPQLNVLGRSFVDHIVDPVPLTLHGVISIAFMKTIPKEDYPFPHMDSRSWYTMFTNINTSWMKFPFNLDSISACSLTVNLSISSFTGILPDAFL